MHRYLRQAVTRLHVGIAICVGSGIVGAEDRQIRFEGCADEAVVRMKVELVPCSIEGNLGSQPLRISRVGEEPRAYQRPGAHEEDVVMIACAIDVRGPVQAEILTARGMATRA